MSGVTHHFHQATEYSVRRKLENIQALRGIAILMVLFCHIGKYEDDIFSLKNLFPVMTFTGRAGVDLFFVISGFIMISITKDTAGSFKNAIHFIIRRAIRIYPLYWFYSLIYLPIFLLLPTSLTRPEGVEGISLFKSFLLLPGMAAPLLGQGWTLIHEMYFYLVFALFLLWPHRQRLKLLLVWALGIIAFIVLPLTIIPHTPMVAIALNPLTLEFLAGCGVAWLIYEGFHRFALPVFLLGILLFIISALELKEGPRVLLYLIPGSLLVYGAVGMEVRNFYRFPRWLQWIGDISYSLYLSHILSLGLVKRIFVAADIRTGMFVNLSFIILAVGVSLLVAVLSYHYIEKPLLAGAYRAHGKLNEYLDSRRNPRGAKKGEILPNA